MRSRLLRTLTLNEHETAYDVPLSTEERDALQAMLGATIRVQPTVGEAAIYEIRPGSTVGVAQTNDLQVLVQPKVGIRNFAFMVAHSLGLVRWDDAAIAIDSIEDLTEAVAEYFLRETRGAISHGVLHDYRSEEDALSVIRGRIRINDHLRTRYGIAPPIEVRFDEYSEDILENRLLKGAVRALSRMRLRAERTRRALREVDGALGLVELRHFHPSAVPAVRYTRLNQHYRHAVEAARMILASDAWALTEGKSRSSAFLVDMNKLFEDFVVVALREAIHASERTLRQGASVALDVERSVRMEPDITYWRNGRCVFVGDVKYKRTEIEGFKHADLYQLHAYVTAHGLDSGLLIYAAGEGKQREIVVRNSGAVLKTVTLDLDVPRDEILLQIRLIAESIAPGTREMPGAAQVRAPEAASGE